MKYLYGPVLSRRLGVSLGIELVPHKTCSYDCIYCQCGRTVHKTLKRAEYVPIRQVLKEVKSFISSYRGRLDYLTFSGAGEPTLHSRLGQVIRRIKRITNKPVAVLTNSSLIGRPDVQNDLLAADLVVPSLDAATPKALRAVNRITAIKPQTIINGLVKFRQRFKGKIWLEVLLVRLYNDDKKNLEALKKAIKRIKPDRVQLNTVTRPPSEDFAYPLSQKELKKIARFLGANTEVIAEHRRTISSRPVGKDPRTRIHDLLARRPCRLSEIARSLGLHTAETLKYISQMERQNKIKRTSINKQTYYHLRARGSKPMAVI